MAHGGVGLRPNPALLGRLREHLCLQAVGRPWISTSPSSSFRPASCQPWCCLPPSLPPAPLLGAQGGSWAAARPCGSRRLGSLWTPCSSWRTFPTAAVRGLVSERIKERSQAMFSQPSRTNSPGALLSHRSQPATSGQRCLPLFLAPAPLLAFPFLSWPSRPAQLLGGGSVSGVSVSPCARARMLHLA